MRTEGNIPLRVRSIPGLVLKGGNSRDDAYARTTRARPALIWRVMVHNPALH